MSFFRSYKWFMWFVKVPPSHPSCVGSSSRPPSSDAEHSVAMGPLLHGLGPSGKGFSAVHSSVATVSMSLRPVALPFDPDCFSSPLSEPVTLGTSADFRGSHRMQRNGLTQRRG